MNTLCLQTSLYVFFMELWVANQRYQLISILYILLQGWIWGTTTVVLSHAGALFYIAKSLVVVVVRSLNEG